MRSRNIALVLGIVPLIQLIAIKPAAIAHQREQERRTSSVLVELFTSEGCSSCPPADRALSQLRDTQPIPGVHIITLSEHVDYWNYLGWRDPYSSDLYSQRQSLYASQFHNFSVYTPQMIVDGRSEFSGGNYDQAISNIKAAADLPKASLVLEAKKIGDHVDLKGKITFPDGLKAGEVSLYIALVEDKLHSVVNRGENSGHTLEHSSVVRQLINTGNISVGKSIQFEKVIKLAPLWKHSNLRAIAFAQDTANLHILGATESRLTVPPASTAFPPAPE